MITCDDLWMVFGDHAMGGVAEARRDHEDVAAIAERLSERGLIPAVCGVSFEVKEGELFVIMGLSGSGKSTVIRCLSRLIEPTAGKVEIDGENILSASKQALIELRRHKMGMVFQHFGLFPHMTVAENVAFPLKVQGQEKTARLGRAHEVIELVGLEGREEAYPRELSGGQRQRVGIARSLAVNPAIWFLDEPFSALDPLIRRQLQDEFLRLQATLKKTIVFITHDIGEALRLADRIAIMRDGVIVQIGTPDEIVLKPADDYVAQFSRDIPRGRHMTVASLTGTPVSGNFDGAPCLKASMSLDEALAVCASAYPELPVADDDGNIIGTVSAERMAKAASGEAVQS
ncbi:MAG: glycine betaine/L-proline ABC transporter ATP-binding protein [Alphaproteobacteria bacterium]|nr:glycine betaine/L-proline ABC transporter ATP-binding protein [Alphaproteobacteria bacterium]